MSFLTPSPSSTLQTRSKAIYALSGLLKHNAPAVKQLSNPNVEGWSRLRGALQGLQFFSCLSSFYSSKITEDPEITVRRKSVFLLGTLLLPTTPISSIPHSQQNLHTPASPSPDQPSEPVHDNSHAVQVKNPLRTSTFEATLEAFKAHGILEAVVSAITEPLPYGEDGDAHDPDPTFEQHCLRYIFSLLSDGFDPELESLLGCYIRTQFCVRDTSISH